MPNELDAGWMQQIQSRTEAALDRLLPVASTAPARLHSAMRYAMLGGGKRVRPLLCHAAGDMFDAAASRLDAAACAIELIHGYSLVHDDLPCMDNDVLRRGKPTCHVQFDEATALLAGDALQSLAFRALADAELGPASFALLADAAGSRGMAGGQGIDLAAVGTSLTLAELEAMHAAKTGALIRAAVLLGAQCGGAEANDIAALSQFAASAGLLFQIVDDILDAEASTEALGKTAGKDARHNKPTYVSLLGLAGAKQKAEDMQHQAVAPLARYGARAARLSALTHYIATRGH